MHKENVMKRNYLGTLSLAVLALSFTIGARAQSIEQANVPFAFQAGTTQLPAGHYLIVEDHLRQRVRMSNVESGLVAVIPVQQGFVGAVKATLIFHNIRDQHFLAEIRGGPDSLDLTIPPSKKEKQAESLKVAAVPAQTTLVALK
jgi:hypothetical protein